MCIIVCARIYSDLAVSQLALLHAGPMWYEVGVACHRGATHAGSPEGPPPPCWPSRRGGGGNRRLSAGARAQPCRPVDGAPYAGQLLVTAQPRTAAEVERLWALADNVLAPHDPAVTAHTLVVTPATLERMRAAGLAGSAQPVDVQEIVDRAAVRRPAVAATTGRLGIFGAALASVPDLDGVYRRLEELEQASGGGAQVVTIGTSVEGRPLRALRI